MPGRHGTDRATRARILALAYQVLSDLSDHPNGPLTVSASDELGSITVTFTPAGSSAGSNLSLSQIERDIVQALSAGPMGGKQLAARAGYPYNSTLRIILANLVDRGILATGDQGYSLSDTR